MNKRDYIYYNYIFNRVIPKNVWQFLYCKLRRLITIKESPSKVTIWAFSEQNFKK